MSATYRTHKTKKLFYDKYVNKIVLDTPVAFMFRGMHFETIKSNISFHEKITDPNGWKYLSPAQIKYATDLYKWLKKQDKDYSVRVEYQRLTFYSNNKSFIEKIKFYSKGLIREISVPESDEIEQCLLNGTHLIIKDKIDFKYRLKLKPFKKNNVEFYEWAKQMSGTINVVNSTLSCGWCYVLDDNALLLCKLYLGSNIQRIDEYVLKSLV